MKLISLAFLLSLTFATQVKANVKIKGLDFSKNAHRGTISIKYDGVLRGDPELLVSGKTISVIMPNSKVHKPIEKSVSFSSKLKDTNLKAYQTTQKETKIKASFAFDVNKRKELINLTLRDNKIELSFPRIKVNLKKAPKYSSITPKKKKVKKEFLNEDYLNNLLKVDKKSVANKNKVIKPKSLLKKTDAKVDTVKSQQSALARTGSENPSNTISLVEYAGKFVAFLGVVLLLFYGIVTVMKKGFIKKGKLGFLNNAEQISVINQTYIAPKKSLMLIKAHNQVFLVSNTDAGIQPISEIRDAAGLFKDGEKAISGHNFDTKLNLAEVDTEIETKIKLKEDITQSNQKSAKSSYSEVKDKVKFSDQLKKKVQGLKPLQ